MHTEHWGLLIAVYLFLGGLGAGALMISASATLVPGGERYPHIASTGALVSPLPVVVGTALLVFDLGRPLFFFKLFLAFQPLSPMWLGSWLLLLFTGVSLAYAYTFLPPWARLGFPLRSSWRRPLAIVGAIAGFLVAVYTAVLLGMLVARPLWNTPLLTILFLLSALSTAAALVLVVVPRAERHVLVRLDVTLVALELIVLAALLLYGVGSSLSSRQAIAMLVGGDYAVAFWAGVVLFGLVVPLALEAAALLRPHGAAGEWLAAGLVLSGGFFLRYVIVSAGQQTGLV